MSRFNHLLPNGFIGGSEDPRFHISSRGARLIIYWGNLSLLFVLIWSGILVATNAESCDQVNESVGCRITKDAFGNYQIGNIVLLAIIAIVFLGFLYMSFRMAGSLARVPRIAENRNYSLFLVMATIFVFVLALSQWILGWVLLYKKSDTNEVNSGCTANRNGLVAILLWIVLITSLILIVTMVLGVGGYGTKAVTTPAPSDPSDSLEEPVGRTIV